MAKVQRITVEMVVEDEAGNQVAESRVVGGSKLDASYDVTNMIALVEAMIHAQAATHIDQVEIMLAQLAEGFAQLDAATDRLSKALAEMTGRA